MNRNRLVCYFLTLTVMAAFVPASFAQVRVACIGASITYGAGVVDREKNGYPAQMQNLLGDDYDVRNFGVSSRTMLKHGDFPYWNDQAYQRALAFNPDIVVIDLGGNDSKPQNWKFKDEFAADTRAMIESFRSLPARPRVLVCLPMPAFKVMWGINDKVIAKELSPILRQVAAETASELVDLHTPFMGKQAWFADSIHPNAEGAALMAKIIGEMIARWPQLPGIVAAIQAEIDKHEVTGAVTVVVTRDKVLHLQATGLADVAAAKPMQPDSLFWIASMTKPVTAVAVLMLQDEGKLNLADPVAKYIPAFADLKTPLGKPANLTITQILTHTSGLGEAPAAAAREAHTLADLVPLWLAAPMQYEPGAKWQYTQSGINLAARIVEVVSGLSFDAFVQKRILDPLGMKDTTFYPVAGSVVTAYVKNRTTGALDPTPPRADFGVRGRPPLGNGGLYSTGPDYARFCQMLLGGGMLDGKRYLSPEAMRLLTTVQTGELPCGFFQSPDFGGRGVNYGWGIGTCILRTPHEGVAAMLSPGTFGHGGAWGTQAWIDPVRGVAYVLMVQRSNFPNSDASGVRRAFQQAAVDAPAKRTINKHSPTTKYPSYNGLVMAGYQGWFRVGRDGQMYPNESRIRIDMWPDVSEYEKTYPTGLKLADGTTARFFNSADKSTVDLHFKWMKDYGLDGVFMQRFFGSTRPNARNGPEGDVLRYACQAASENQRAIAVMYDLSGLRNSGEDCLRIADDWKFLVDTLQVTNQVGAKTYLHHRGRPLVVIWGVGFPDRGYDIKNIALDKLIDFFHNDPEYGGCSVMLGVPTYWRDLNADCRNEPYLHELIKKADLVMPWMVQRFSPLLHNDMWHYRDVIKADMKWCQANGVDYVPCVYPGFSWHNLSRFEFPDDVKPVGSIPRQGGRFYWQLISTAIGAGADKLYVAMFDEVNEGTAIFKCTDHPPVSNVAKFIDMDGKPSDHYLWLTGEAGKMLRKEKPLSTQMPQREQ